MNAHPRHNGKWTTSLALLQLTVLSLACGVAQAQNAVRGPVVEPPAQTMKAAAQQGLSSEEQAAAAHTDDGQAQAGTHRNKFPNRDTAKNRQDYNLGTDAGAENITLGRDKKSGDTVLRNTPPKKTEQKIPFVEQPIQVRPIVPSGRRGSSGN
jgi:hypothetical protein